MARHMATRGHPSSTQQDANDYPGIALDEDDGVDDSNLLTIGEDSNEFVINDSNYNYAPQFDNPSFLLPDDEDDYALKEHLNSQQQLHEQQQQAFQQELEQEFDLDFNNQDNSSDDEEEDKEVDHDDTVAADVNNSTHHCTQGTLDAASILVGGFDSNNIQNTNNHRPADAAVDNEERSTTTNAHTISSNNTPQQHV